MKKRKIKKEKPTTDFFCKLVKSELGLDVTLEHRFHETRRWRFDYAILDHKIAIEKDGGLWLKGGGAHSRPQNIKRDMEKLTQASVLGWIVIRRTPQELNSTETMNLIREAIKNKA
ncbi:hypothetical protein [Albibacterium profundi]|uniref:DUF559 domain-containing protein n=1 Tax=Albibacterium profundi TaxID=3134906 RepID=A0ABV5CFJ9_9SPHI